MRKTIENIETPAILLDLGILDNNMNKFHAMANNGRKEIWPMVKTHKSTKIALWQHEHKYGASGFLCGTLDECEALECAMTGINIMYAYPVASEPNISRVVKLAKSEKCKFYVRIDNCLQAKALHEIANRESTQINYTVIINSGLNRFGVNLCNIESFMGKIKCYSSLEFKGISTHPGHVYMMEDEDVNVADRVARVVDVARQETNTMEEACRAFYSIGLKPEIVTSGSTPTYSYTVNNNIIDTLHPGNYIFMDNIQIYLGCAEEKDCALTVLATVVSVTKDNEYIIDAGSKCFGDQSVHGNNLIKGFGCIKNHLELILYSLSEEVGKIKARENVDVRLNIGEKIEIIPNHSCSTANMTSKYICMREGVVDATHPFIDVDIRSNLTRKGINK